MWEKREKDGLIYYTLPKWQDAGAKVVMSCRLGGESEAPYDRLNLGLHVDDEEGKVVANRRRFLKAIDGNEGDFVSIKQVHGNRILRATKEHCGLGFASYRDAVDDTDGIFTTEKHVLMATFYADCLPVAIFHPEKKWLGLAHAGWKGTYQHIAGELFKAMSQGQDIHIEDCWCALGAGIGSCCYEVDEIFRRRFLERYDKAAQWFREEEGKIYFDNVKANLCLLKEMGVKEENMDVLGLCTSCHNDLFFSYRKEHGKTGRHGLWGELI